MAKKTTPLHQMLGIPAPEVVRGYHDYGVRWTAAEGPQRESLRHAVTLALWSWAYWGKKVRQDILDRPSASLAMRTADRAMLALIAAVTRLHRSIG